MGQTRQSAKDLDFELYSLRFWTVKYHNLNFYNHLSGILTILIFWLSAKLWSVGDKVFLSEFVWQRNIGSCVNQFYTWSKWNSTSWRTSICIASYGSHIKIIFWHWRIKRKLYQGCWWKCILRCIHADFLPDSWL